MTCFFCGQDFVFRVLWKKSETTTYVRKFVADMNNMGRPHCFRTDNGGEFTSRDYVEFCDSAGIRREYTAPDSKGQIGLGRGTGRVKCLCLSPSPSCPNHRQL